MRCCGTLLFMFLRRSKKGRTNLARMDWISSMEVSFLSRMRRECCSSWRMNDLIFSAVSSSFCIRNVRFLLHNKTMTRIYNLRLKKKHTFILRFDVQRLCWIHEDELFSCCSDNSSNKCVGSSNSLNAWIKLKQSKK